MSVSLVGRSTATQKLHYLGAGSALAVMLCLTSFPSNADTRGYVISWFATATDIPDYKADCPKGQMNGQTDMYARQLRDLGYSQEEALKIVADSGEYLTEKYMARIGNHAQVNGHPASIFNYPEAVADPNIETVTGPYAYGFDLGGKATNKLEDPETHAKVDNQLWRAVGCQESFHAPPPGKPYPEELSWNLMIDSAPAWTMQISGKDLSKDGPVTITLDSATQHLERDANGNVEADTSYVVRPISRSHNVLHGEIKNGMLTITPKDIYLEGELPFYSEIALRNAHMRFKAAVDGKLVGYWGGYLNWKTWVYMHTSRPGDGADSVGLYHALKKMADSDPDPKTGQNRYISGTFRMEAIPAYLSDSEGKIVAAPVDSPEGLALATDPSAGLKVATQFN